MGISELHIKSIAHVKNNMCNDVEYRIDRPVVGISENISAINFSGWVFCEKKKVKEIQIMHSGRKIRTAKINIPRKDVNSKIVKLKEKNVYGFRVDVGIVGFPENIDFRVRVVFEDNSFVLIARIVGTYSASPYITGSNKVAPILLNSMGRMGTTMMMKLMKSHPLIVSTDTYPYEERPSQYWTHMLKVLSEPANYDESVTTDLFFSSDTFVGNNPFFTLNRRTSSWYSDRYLNMLGDFANNAINDYYHDQAIMQGKDRAGFFIEKMMSPNTPFWDIYNRIHGDVKNIFLVRDIRDVYCSVIDFNKKRGYLSFGANKSMGATEYFDLLGSQYTSLFHRWITNSDAILVKYEDLVKDSPRELRKILDYLGIKAVPADIDTMIAVVNKKNDKMNNHQTSQSPTQSIGRWRHELEFEFAKRASEKFGDVLTSFGYNLA